ncbi:DUF6884 domain-containing protein [Natribacillus halophilus]|uniref:DUF6884 domain-containing protein n=1 Tax=Natribacillus halophilus TaxID=549003 RepID=A0A1G8NGV3_9BACI|nr:DUF6884 domain-containing protein [Natribacillus halophilus]SDI79501.1 hypothetical protein SAMN04488123_10681 [Natribacillus halophilus]
MTTLAIIPCGNKKIWDREGEIGPVFARDAYIGTFHRLCRAYAETFYPQWVILSAKHGFLQPEDTVPGPYNLSFSHKSDDIIPMQSLAEQVQRKRLNDFQHLVVLTGKKYKPIVEKSFGPGHDIEMPLLGSRGIGEMQQKLKQAVSEGRPL